MNILKNGPWRSSVPSFLRNAGDGGVAYYFSADQVNNLVSELNGQGEQQQQEWTSFLLVYYISNVCARWQQDYIFLYL